jgi:hypothetical protein
MKTKLRESGQVQKLPPPPAPTARDANPWTIPGSRSVADESGASAADFRITRRAPAAADPVRRPLRLRWLPFAVLAAIAIGAGSVAARSIIAGDPRGAIGPLALVAFAIFSAWRQLRYRGPNPLERRR